MRKCKFNMNFRSKEDFDDTWGLGDFHQWGCDYEEFETGPGNYTVGIVEDSDGKIHQPFPENIVFLDKEEADT